MGGEKVKLLKKKQKCERNKMKREHNETALSISSQHYCVPAALLHCVHSPEMLYCYFLVLLMLLFSHDLHWTCFTA